MRVTIYIVSITLSNCVTFIMPLYNKYIIISLFCHQVVKYICDIFNFKMVCTIDIYIYIYIYTHILQ